MLPLDVEEVSSQPLLPPAQLPAPNLGEALEPPIRTMPHPQTLDV